LGIINNLLSLFSKVLVSLANFSRSRAGNILLRLHGSRITERAT
jgi:hypothetical protein